MMKKTFKFLIILLLVFCISTNGIYASTYVNSTLENKELSDIAFSNLPTPAQVLNIPFGFFGVFIKGFLILGLFYFLVTIICKLIIEQKKSIKNYLSAQKLGKIMDRMYEYKKDA